MKRERKFRAWDRVKMKMVYPTNENHPEYNFEIYLDGSFSVTSDGLVDGKWRQVCRDSKDFELMEFTGLKDKNGNDIYEGDMLQIPNYLSGGEMTVEWDECSTSCDENGSYVHSFGYNFQEYDYEKSIINCNIYQNPFKRSPSTSHPPKKRHPAKS